MELPDRLMNRWRRCLDKYGFVVITLIILIIRLWPFRFFIKNQTQFMNGNTGIKFGEFGILYSSERLELREHLSLLITMVMTLLTLRDQELLQDQLSILHQQVTQQWTEYEYSDHSQHLLRTLFLQTH